VAQGVDTEFKPQYCKKTKTKPKKPKQNTVRFYQNYQHGHRKLSMGKCGFTAKLAGWGLWKEND
jgi:hypothetical protein